MSALIFHRVMIGVVALCLLSGVAVDAGMKSAYAIAPEEQLSETYQHNCVVLSAKINLLTIQMLILRLICVVKCVNSLSPVKMMMRFWLIFKRPMGIIFYSTRL